MSGGVNFAQNARCSARWRRRDSRDLGAEIAAVEALLVSPDVSKLNAGCDDKGGGGGRGVGCSLPPRSAWKLRGVRKLKTFSRTPHCRGIAPHSKVHHLGSSFQFRRVTPIGRSDGGSREFVLSRCVRVIFTTVFPLIINIDKSCVYPPPRVSRNPNLPC